MANRIPRVQAESEDNLRLMVRCLAHDLNNIVGAILAHAQLIGTDDAAVIERAAARAAGLIEQLLECSPGGVGKSVPVDVHESIREVAGLLRPSIDPGIALTLRLEAPDAVIAGDRGEFHRMLFNLALNARDAMPRGGELIFATSRVDATSSLLVSVQDSGSGFAPELRTRIFQPFFTTKTPGNGSGMGLAIVKRVAENHGGVVEVASVEGRGSEFRILLPLLEPAPAAQFRAMRMGPLEV